MEQGNDIEIELPTQQTPLELSEDGYNGVPNSLVGSTLIQSESQSPSFSSNSGINQGQDPPAASSFKQSNKVEDSESGHNGTEVLLKRLSRLTSLPTNNYFDWVKGPDFALGGEAISRRVIDSRVLFVNGSRRMSFNPPHPVVVPSTSLASPSFAGNNGNGVATGQGPAASSSQSKIQEDTSSVTAKEVPSPTKNNGVNVDYSDEVAESSSSSKRSIQEDASEPGNMSASKKSCNGVTRSEVTRESIPGSMSINSFTEESNGVPNSVVASTLQSTRSFSVNNEINKGSDPPLAAASSSQSSIHQENPSENSNTSQTEAGGQQGSALQNVGHIPQFSYLQQQYPTLQERCEKVNKKLEQQLQDQNTSFQNHYLQPDVTHAEQIEAWQTHLQIQTLLFKQHIQTHNSIIQRHQNSCYTS